MASSSHLVIDNTRETIILTSSSPLSSCLRVQYINAFVRFCSWVVKKRIVAVVSWYSERHPTVSHYGAFSELKKKCHASATLVPNFCIGITLYTINFIIYSVCPIEK